MNPTCEQATGLSDEQFWRSLSGKIARERVPYSGSLALTHRCNLRCLHCYLKDEVDAIDGDRPELNTAQWLRIISEVRDAGCLNLLLTGGEPLLRPDFPEIYSFAKQNGFLVNVFTNGTLITEGILELFRELPPRLVDISLYGATAETYERITGVPGSFRRVIAGIEALLAQGTHIGLKSVLLTLNEGEFSRMETLAGRYGVKFRRDAAIFPSFSGDRSPIDLRVPPERVVEMEMADPNIRKDWRDFFDRYKGAATSSGLYLCGAGRSTFHVDPCGELYPCVMVKNRSHSLRAGNFTQGWNGEISRLQGDEAAPGFRCVGCGKKLACGYCPGFFEIENGRPDMPSEYLCALGHLRDQRLANNAPGGYNEEDGNEKA